MTIKNNKKAILEITAKGKRVAFFCMAPKERTGSHYKLEEGQYQCKRNLPNIRAVQNRTSCFLK